MIHSSHTRLAELVARYGTDEERAEHTMLAELMQAALDAVPGSSWERVTEITLPTVFHDRVRTVARARQKLASRFAMENAHGVVRELDDEIRSAAGQYAACIMLELPFNKNIDNAEARRNGNLGSNVSAMVPRPGSYGLIVGEKEPTSRRMVLIQQTGEWTFEWIGWIRAGAAKLPQYQREFNRYGRISRPYVVPAEYLSSPRDWA